MPLEASSWPSDRPWIRPLLCSYHLLVIALLTALVATRISSIQWRKIRQGEYSFARACIVCLLLASWLFAFLSTILLFGLNPAASASTCDWGIWICIIFYIGAKLFVYLFFMERVYVVHTGKQPPRRFLQRFSSRWYSLSAVFMLGWLGLAAAVIYARDAGVHPNGLCHIGVKRAAVIPATVADALFHIYLTCVFVYFLLKSGSPMLDSSRSVITESCIATLVSMATTTGNLISIIIMKGHQAAHVCIAACLTDVAVSAVVFFWVTRKASHDRVCDTHDKQDIASTELPDLVLLENPYQDASTPRSPQPSTIRVMLGSPLLRFETSRKDTKDTQLDLMK